MEPRIFEPVAEALASNSFIESKKQYVLGTVISEEAQLEIQHIINELSTGKNPNKIEEINRIGKVACYGKMNKLKTVKVDLFLKDKKGHIHLFDLKTCLLYTSPSPRDLSTSRMPSSA